MSGQATEIDTVGLVVCGDDRKDRNGFLFVTVAIKANNTVSRYVEATGFVGGVEIGRISCADNSLNGVISSPHQMMTIPVPPGYGWQVKWNVANNQGEVKVYTYR